MDGDGGVSASKKEVDSREERMALGVVLERMRKQLEVRTSEGALPLL